MVQSIFLFVIALIFLWIGSGLVVGIITRISQSLHISSFFVSFFILGLFSSITEIMVGINAFLQNEPEIFVGNLVGSSVVGFLLVIPTLAIISNGIKINHAFELKDLVSAAFVVGFPALLTLDNVISFTDGLICLGVYLYFFYIQQQKSHSIHKLIHVHVDYTILYKNAAIMLGGMILVFIGSNLLVDQTQTIGTMFGISPFIIGLLIISIGTNIPEISIAVRALIIKQRDIALGNYIGSASFNTLELGILTTLSTAPISANGSNFSVVTFLIGLAAFVYFGKSQRTLSKKEGFIMLSLYFIFVICEILTGPGWRL